MHAGLLPLQVVSLLALHRKNFLIWHISDINIRSAIAAKYICF